MKRSTSRRATGLLAAAAVVIGSPSALAGASLLSPPDGGSDAPPADAISSFKLANAGVVKQNPVSGTQFC